MQSGELTRQIQTQPMTRNRGADRATMESLENMLLGRAVDRSAAVADVQQNFSFLSLRRNSDPAAWSVVLSRVLEKILHNEGGVTLFAGNI